MKNNISLNRKQDTLQKNISSLTSLKNKDGFEKIFSPAAKFTRDNGLKKSATLTTLSAIKRLEAELAFERMRHRTEISQTVMHVKEIERTRLGNELHDNISQILSAAKLFAETLQPSNIKDREKKNKTVEYILLAIEEIRKLSRKWVTPPLDKKGFTEIIQT